MQHTAISAEIMEFIKGNRIATLCCCEADKPYCFNCFYSVPNEEGTLIFKSSESTRHMQIISTNNSVAGTIIASDISMNRIEGLQFEGRITDSAQGLKGSATYYSRYPFAVTVPGRLWTLEIDAIKYTKTVNGISTKKAWAR